MTTKTQGRPINVSKRRQKRKEQKGPTMAEQADRHVLYQESVQCVEAEIDFVDEKFEELRGRKAVTLREDFAGTGNTSCEWIRRRDGNIAIAVDLDGEVLGWGREHNVGSLSEEAKQRITLLEENVLDVETDKVDVLLSMNFSYWLFEDRKTLGAYFKKVHSTLKDDGIYFLDAYGGWEAHQECKEDRECEGFDYVWEQVSFDPISSHMDCAIHFKFPDGSKWKNAFKYSWRLWSLPEIRELLEEAGFGKVSFYWEGADEDGDGNGEFELVTEAESDPGWICYIVAEK